MHNWMERDFLEASKLKPYKGLINYGSVFVWFSWLAGDPPQELWFVFTVMPITMVQIVIHSVLGGTIAVVTTIVIKLQETKSA